MKVLAVLALSCAVVALVSPAEGTPRVRPRTLQRRRQQLKATRAVAADVSSLDCGGQLESCTSCSTRLQCAKLAGNYRPVQTLECAASTPYCSAGQCVATLPSNASCVTAPPVASDFVCNGDGYYPAPGDCRRYYLCVGASAYEYDCTASTASVYSHPRAMCVPTTEAKCTTVSCTNALIGQYQTYGPDPEVYFVCTDTTAANALVAACPANYTVDSSTGDCQLACLSEGRLADSSNSSNYYECTKTGANSYSKPQLLACPSGSTFSADRQRCLTGNEDKPAAVATQKGYTEDYYKPDANVDESEYNVPSTLKIGAASSAYQVEGGWNASDKTPSIQDVFFHSRPTLTANGDVTNDAYHNYKQDVAVLKQLQMQFYRFSISWPRVLPTGNSTAPSADGVAYYNSLINELAANGLDAVVTLYHWDLPQVYQDDGGWLNAAIQERFVDFATFCFQQFGDRVKTWLLVNEPLSQCVYGYEQGGLAPAISQPGTGAYLCNHNMVLSHAKAYRAYESNFKATQNGQVGSAVNMAFAQPLTTSQEDADAAERWNQWQYSWFVDPIYFGDYPAVMRQTIDALSAEENRTTSRLPSFTDAEKAILKGSLDFLGLNLYSGVLATPAPKSSAGYNNDAQVATSYGPTWIMTTRDSFMVTPWHLADAVRWLRDRYNNTAVWVTENGYNGAKNEGVNDTQRSGYYSGFMRGLMQAINRDKCNVIGYTAWSLEDNLEWGFGYLYKFGLVYVDFNDPARPRTVKNSGAFFNQVANTKHVPYIAAT